MFISSIMLLRSHNNVKNMGLDRDAVGIPGFVVVENQPDFHC